MNTRPIRIVVVDDHPLFRDGLRRLLEAEPGFIVVGEGADGSEAIRLVWQTCPDVLLLDLSMPGISGSDTPRALASTGPCVRTLVLTGSFDLDTLACALQQGAAGVMRKESSTTLLFKAIRAIAAGEYWVCGGPVATAADAVRCLRADSTTNVRSHRFSLTRRELEIVAAVAAGESNKEIAERLAISKYTIKHHLANVFDKVGVFSRVELAAFAMHHGLVESGRPQA